MSLFAPSAIKAGRNRYTIPQCVGLPTLLTRAFGERALMVDVASDSAFVFLGLTAAGDCPAMELVVCADAGEAIARARQWLTSHRTCVRAQVWKDDVLLADVFSDRAQVAPGATAQIHRP